jgi:hypothetical protein
MSADRITPVGVASVNHHVARREALREFIEQGIDHLSRRNVEQDNAGRRKLVREIGKRCCRREAGTGQVFGYPAFAQADNVKALLQRLAGESAPDFAETYHGEVDSVHGGHVCHSSLRCSLVGLRAMRS